MRQGLHMKRLDSVFPGMKYCWRLLIRFPGMRHTRLQKTRDVWELPRVFFIPGKRSAQGSSWPDPAQAGELAACVGAAEEKFNSLSARIRARIASAV